MLFELVAQKETEHGAIDLMESIKIMKGIGSFAKKHWFDAYCKGYPKGILDYVPSGQTYQIKTVEDIARLTPNQFEMFLEDLRQFCATMQVVSTLNEMWIETQTNDWMTWIDDGDNQAKITVHAEITNKL